MRAAVEEIKLASAAIVPTRESERQLRRINKGHGGLAMDILQRELAGYIYCHEHAGQGLDSEGQVLRFDERVSVLLRRLEGVWHILRIWRRDAGEVCRPVYLWREIRRGWVVAIARILAGWRYERGLPLDE